MKKIFSIILCAAVVLVSGCSVGSQEEQSQVFGESTKPKDGISGSESTSNNVSTNSHTGNSDKSDESIESEIEEVDKWGVSLDDVDRLAKQAIRKYENISDYRQDYRKAVRETDDFLDDVESGKKTEISLADFLKKYNTACEAGIEYIEASDGRHVKTQYEMCTRYGELDKSDKDYIRRVLALFNGSIENIEQSITDMENLLNPIIEEDRNLTDDELEKVFEIYQVLVDKVDAIS